jgi:hypothetical protein
MSILLFFNHFLSAVFNELYYLADGGSVWLDVDPGESLPPADLR